jgi:hypothetical protein
MGRLASTDVVVAAGGGDGGGVGLALGSSARAAAEPDRIPAAIHAIAAAR